MRSSGGLGSSRCSSMRSAKYSRTSRAAAAQDLEVGGAVLEDAHDPVGERGLLLDGDPDQPGDHPHRQVLGVVDGRVGPVAAPLDDVRDQVPGDVLGDRDAAARRAWGRTRAAAAGGRRRARAGRA